MKDVELEADNAIEMEEALLKATRVEMVQVSPDKNLFVPTDENHVPEMIAARFVPDGTGQYRCIPQKFRFLRVNKALMKLLGFGLNNDATIQSHLGILKRLAIAEFITLVQVSPGCYMLDLDSWYRHLMACMQRPDFWAKGGENRDEYLRVNKLSSIEIKE